MLSDNEQSSKFTGWSLTLFFSAESSDLIATASISFGAFANRAFLDLHSFLILTKGVSLRITEVLEAMG